MSHNILPSFPNTMWRGEGMAVVLPLSGKTTESRPAGNVCQLALLPDGEYLFVGKTPYLFLFFFFFPYTFALNTALVITHVLFH